MALTRTLLVFLTLSLLAVVDALEAEAQPPTVVVPTRPERMLASDEAKLRARDAYQKAKDFYEKNELKNALLAADLAYASTPNANTALIRATILGELKRHMDAFKAYLTGLALEPTPGERQLIVDGLEEHSSKTKPPMGWVEFSVMPPGAKVEIVGAEPFVPPLAIGISEGSHSVTISAKGHVSKHETVEVRAGKGTSFGSTLESKSLPGNGKPVAQPDRSAAIALMVSGGVLLLNGGAFHIWALDAKDETDKYSSAAQTPWLSEEERRQRHGDAEDDLSLRQTVAFLSYGVGGAALIGGVILFVVQTDSEPGAVKVHAAPTTGGAALFVETGF